MLTDISDLLPDLESPEECLRRVAVCEQIAKREPSKMLLLMELAGHWRKRAKEIETLRPPADEGLRLG